MLQTAAPGPSNGARDDAHSPTRSSKRGGKASASSTKKGDPSVPAGSSVVFQCCGFGDCRMVFTRSEHLARHVRKHTGERPFQCHCQKSFSRLDNLRQHCQTVHSDVPERNEEMLRRLTAVHADLAADAAKHQRMYARVVHHADLNADKSGSDSKSGGQSRGRRAAAAAAATNAASSASAAQSRTPSSSESVSPAPKRARHSPRESAASAAPTASATSPPEAQDSRLPSLKSINETERTQGWSSQTGTVTKTEDLSPKSTESHWTSPESYYVSSPQPTASAMPRSRYTWRPPAQLPRSASMSWAHAYPPRAPPALGRSAGSSRSLPCPSADPRTQWYMAPHGRPTYWRSPGAPVEPSPYSVPRAAPGEREAVTPPAPSPPSAPAMPSRPMIKPGGDQNPAHVAPLPPLVALDRLRQDDTRIARPGPVPHGARACGSTTYGPMSHSSAPYGHAPDAYEPMGYRRQRWSISGDELHDGVGITAAANGAALGPYDAGSYYAAAHPARKRKDYSMT